ncbi:hypothetical protein RRG08_006828 [Elysia crispata]|uniref:Uncharacterized protein n=1 Tax=Elysia crispata TaxID=231223 RepID=A0AAE0XWM0_9GAST|nr:hypothetical protein RRG08_006828 [Elysia crispata]
MSLRRTRANLQRRISVGELNGNIQRDTGILTSPDLYGHISFTASTTPLSSLAPAKNLKFSFEDLLVPLSTAARDRLLRLPIGTTNPVTDPHPMLPPSAGLAPRGTLVEVCKAPLGPDASKIESYKISLEHDASSAFNLDKEQPIKEDAHSPHHFLLPPPTPTHTPTHHTQASFSTVKPRVSLDLDLCRCPGNSDRCRPSKERSHLPDLGENIFTCLFSGHAWIWKMRSYPWPQLHSKQRLGLGPSTPGKPRSALSLGMSS